MELKTISEKEQDTLNIRTLSVVIKTLTGLAYHDIDRMIYNNMIDFDVKSVEHTAYYLKIVSYVQRTLDRDVNNEEYFINALDMLSRCSGLRVKQVEEDYNTFKVTNRYENPLYGYLLLNTWLKCSNKGVLCSFQDYLKGAVVENICTDNVKLVEEVYKVEAEDIDGLEYNKYIKNNFKR